MITFSPLRPIWRCHCHEPMSLIYQCLASWIGIRNIFVTFVSRADSGLGSRSASKLNGSWAPGRHRIQGGGDRFSVHFAVTFLDCWRTSFCVTTIIKIIKSNTNDLNKHLASMALHYIRSTVFVIVVTQKLVLQQSKKVYGKPIAPPCILCLLAEQCYLRKTRAAK